MYVYLLGTLLTVTSHTAESDDISARSKGHIVKVFLSLLKFFFCFSLLKLVYYCAWSIPIYLLGTLLTVTSDIATNPAS